MTRAPSQTHSDTSVAAADAILSVMPAVRAIVYRDFVRCCQTGTTDEEQQDRIEMNPSTQRPRRVELVKAGLVVDSELKRKTRSGRKAVVWVLSKYVTPKAGERTQQTLFGMFQEPI